ncbi:OprD family porin [Hymenobacter sp. 15J16-1T3B]|uniref:OprD family outer membrane porin n=1 Tax=Hymenobacter sp. 15J16-1T3B TaxID=2886941 RepID=UPI001D1131FB|nr:OprD family outer membrane porin [Hymenobacter sp. 15J16-1T3B]MCC3158620.1 OprD family porin [Hymenobacter sp. 15J16-1T3B]
MIRWFLLGAALLAGARPGIAQSTAPDTLRRGLGTPPVAEQAAPADSTAGRTLGNALRRGLVGVRVRTVFMATLNQGAAADYVAQGVGAALGYETQPWHGLQAGLKSSFQQRLYANELAAVPGRPESRYELSLFDLEHPRRQALRPQVEELWLRWQQRSGKLQLTYGRQRLDTPLLNAQDSRLRPNVVQGLWLAAKPDAATTVQGGWLTHVAPRSVGRWYRLGAAVGRYGMGVATDSARADYQGHVPTPGLAVLGVRRTLGPRATMQLWQYWADHLLATSLLEGTVTRPRPAGTWTASGLLLWQHALATGRGLPAAQRYLDPGEQARALSLRLAYQRRAWQLAGHYTRLTAHGRYLFPREWGREPFYTTLPRERIEGAGDVHALGATVAWLRPHAPRLEAGYGYYNLPPAAWLNKYSLPDFHQLNLSMSHRFAGAAEGLQLRTLYTAKWGANRATYLPARAVNKVDLHHLTVALEYGF